MFLYIIIFLAERAEPHSQIMWLELEMYVCMIRVSSPWANYRRGCGRAHFGLKLARETSVKVGMVRTLVKMFDS